MSQASQEVDLKLATMRRALAAHGLAALRLRGVDFFAWATGGGSSVVLLTAEAGVAEVLVTGTAAFVLTDRIEVERLAAEEVREPYKLWSAPWQEPEQRLAFVRDTAGGGPVASDRPVAGELPLPPEVVAAKRRLGPEEILRYRALAADAAAAMTETLTAARPAWSEQELAGRGAAALWARGVHPALTLAASERRSKAFRHPVPTPEQLGGVGMLVFCARRHGLYANLTRFVTFRPPTELERRRLRELADVEAAAWEAARPGATLADGYRAIVGAYARLGHNGEELNHHQGGSTGYLAREVVATERTTDAVALGTALAWNPSLPGAKIEDTVLCTPLGVDILTADPAWPTFQAHGRRRPDFLVTP